MRKNTPPIFSGRLFVVLIKTEALLEAVYASAGIDKLLSSGEKRMTFGADFHLDVLGGRTGLYDVAAGASDSGRLILGMQIFLHSFSPLIGISFFYLPQKLIYCSTAVAEMQDIFLRRRNFCSMTY